MSAPILCFLPDGRIAGLYSEAIDLRLLGRLRIVRATEITHNDATQQWEVRVIASGRTMFSHPSRQACLQWELDNLQPPAGG